MGKGAMRGLAKGSWVLVLVRGGIGRESVFDWSFLVGGYVSEIITIYLGYPNRCLLKKAWEDMDRVGSP